MSRGLKSKRRRRCFGLLVSSGCSAVVEVAKGLKRARSVTSRSIRRRAKFCPGEQAQKTRTVKRREDTNASQVNKGTGCEEPGKGGGPSRGGELGPRVRSGPGGGGRRRPYRKLIRKGLSDRHRGSYRPPAPYHRTRPHAASANRITTYVSGPEKALCLDQYPMVRIFLRVSLGMTPLAGPGSATRHCPLTGRELARYTILAVVIPRNRLARDRRGTCGEPVVNGM